MGPHASDHKPEPSRDKIRVERERLMAAAGRGSMEHVQSDALFSQREAQDFIYRASTHLLGKHKAVVLSLPNVSTL